MQPTVTFRKNISVVGVIISWFEKWEWIMRIIDFIIKNRWWRDADPSTKTQTSNSISIVPKNSKCLSTKASRLVCRTAQQCLKAPPITTSWTPTRSAGWRSLLRKIRRCATPDCSTNQWEECSRLDRVYPLCRERMRWSLASTWIISTNSKAGKRRDLI